MGEFLMGKEVSTTPMETRGGVSAYSTFLQNLLRGTPGSSDQLRGLAAPFQQLSIDSLMSLLAIPQIAELAASPTDRTQGLFRSMVPFEAQQTADQVAGLRSMFGTAGGRFGRNVADAEGRARGELANQFARSRYEALLSAQGQNQNFLANLIGQAGQQAQVPLQAFSNFFQAGPAGFQQGALPGLLSAGANIFAAQSMFGRPGGTGTGPSPGFTTWLGQRQPIGAGWQ